MITLLLEAPGLLIELLIVARSSEDADHVSEFEFPGFGGGFEKSMDAIRDATERSTGGSGSVFLGRPFLGLCASDTWESGLAIFKSLRCLTSKIGSPSTLCPTLIFTVDRDSLSTRGNGPAKPGWRPKALCCFVYTCVVFVGKSGRGFSVGL